ncbi:MAG: thioredoxin-like (seleno)protein SaoT [Syntrophomonadaceae bacterium]
MDKIQIEFINTCSCCMSHEEDIKRAAAAYGDKVDVKFYRAGVDVDYLKKYGMVSRGTMIINGKKKYDSLNREIIEKAIHDALEG